MNTEVKIGLAVLGVVVIGCGALLGRKVMATLKAGPDSPAATAAVVAPPAAPPPHIVLAERTRPDGGAGHATREDRELGSRQSEATTRHPHPVYLPADNPPPEAAPVDETAADARAPMTPGAGHNPFHTRNRHHDVGPPVSDDNGTPPGEIADAPVQRRGRRIGGRSSGRRAAKPVATRECPRSVGRGSLGG